MTKSFANYLAREQFKKDYGKSTIISHQTVQVKSNPLKKEATKENKKGEKEMKKINKTNETKTTNKGENTMKKENNAKETTKLTLTQRVNNLEQKFELQRQFNKKVVDQFKSIEDRFSKFDSIINNAPQKQQKVVANATKQTKETKVVKKETSKKEPSDNTKILTEKLSTLETKTLKLKNIYAIVNHCFKTLNNNKKKIQEYIEYNKQNHRASVNKVVNFYLNENLAKYMER